MKKIFTIISTVLITTTAFTQAEFGIQAGVNISNMIDKQDNPSQKATSKSIPGLNIGAFARIKISSDFFLQPGLQYNQVGGKGDMQEGGVTYEQTQQFSYLSIPITIHYKSPTTGLSIYAGPQLGILVSEKVSGTVSGITFSKDPDMHKSTDFSLLLGVDYSFPMGIIIGLRNQLGIANAIKPEFVTANNPTVVNPRRTINNVTISIGYIIGKTKKQS